MYFKKIHSNVFVFLFNFIQNVILKKVNATEKKTAINQNKNCSNTPMYPFFLVSVLPDLYSVNHKASDDSWSPMQYSLCTLRAPLISILIWKPIRTLPLSCPPSSKANNVNALYSPFCLPFNYYRYDGSNQIL